MVNGFDFAIESEGELAINSESHDIMTLTDDDLRIQLAYNIIKSVTKDWFIDNIGADLELLIGTHCTKEAVEHGKSRIKVALLKDELWDKEDIYIRGGITNNTNIIYNVYLKTYTYDPERTDNEDIYAYRIDVELDLIKGVHIRMGWNPRREGNFKTINYTEGFPSLMDRGVN